MSENITDLTDEMFKNRVSDSKGAVLVDFWAPWCGPCSLVAPVLEKIAAGYSKKLQVYKLNVDDNQTVASKLGVMSIPTLILFRDGKELDRIVGALGEAELKRRIDEKLA